MEDVESLSHLTSNSQLRALTQLLGKLNLNVTMNLTWKPENWTGDIFWQETNDFTFIYFHTKMLQEIAGRNHSKIALDF